ncbi:SPOSA6832_04313 [Sporobolomyces salmonicolor]|uniref:SPOSA6832_04313-mRNA-1:cds n=1 Tax=Sporidiobolus salmonicolor TaxID=5005 RepID=A0A0D6ERN1_SPOSA|nr:SPOSA6832_04313 [Sporobolomyces salmonicolor]
MDLSFSGIVTFAHLPHQRCLEEPSAKADIIVLGIPFDVSRNVSPLVSTNVAPTDLHLSLKTAVSFRPGARFGPNAIRQGSRRHAPNRGFSIPWNQNPFKAGASILDCGDIPVSPYDNALAIDQIETAYSTLLARPVETEWTEGSAWRRSSRRHEFHLPAFTAAIGGTKVLALDRKEHPKILSLGGDHTIVLPILRSLNKVYGPISTHGSFFWKAATEGLIANSTSVHAGIRTRLSEFEDLTHDEDVGFKIFTTDDIDEMKPSGIVQAIKDRVGNTPCYLSFDIDTIDPSMAPASKSLPPLASFRTVPLALVSDCSHLPLLAYPTAGTPESGGWTTREVKAILRGLSSLNLVGLDIVEVSPAYDSNAEVTAMAAADLVQEYLGMLTKGRSNGGQEWQPAVKGGKLYDERVKETKQGHDEL